MKMLPTWQFWAILAFGYLAGGLMGMLIFLEIMLAVLLLNIIAILLIPMPRSEAVRDGLLNKDCWLIKFFCRQGKCTWGEVEIQEPKNLLGRSFLGYAGGAHEKRVGKSYCVGCGKELWLLSYVNLDKINKGKPYWGLLPFEKSLAWNMAQAEK